MSRCFFLYYKIFVYTLKFNAIIAFVHSNNAENIHKNVKYSPHFRWVNTEKKLFQVAECGNLETFQRLYFADPTRLSIKDSRGRTAAHQAAAKNRINILQFILSQGGGKWVVKWLRRARNSLFQTWIIRIMSEIRLFMSLLNTNRLMRWIISCKRKFFLLILIIGFAF